MKLLFQLTVLFFAIQLCGIGCRTQRPKEHEAIKAAEIQLQVISPPAPAVTNQSQLGAEIRDNGEASLESAERTVKEISRGVEELQYLILKELTAMISKNGDNITFSDQTVQTLEASNNGDPRLSRSLREIKETVRELKTAHNNMVAEYNQKMANLNFKYAEAGGLPKGQTEILPRSFPIR